MAVHDDCKLKFLELKAKRTYRFIIYKIEEKQKQVIVEKLGEPTESYEDFAAGLPADECRYAVYDFDFMTEENCQKSRIFFIAWYVWLKFGDINYHLVGLYSWLSWPFVLSFVEGHLTQQGWEARWFMQAPKTGSRESLMDSR